MGVNTMMFSWIQKKSFNTILDLQAFQTPSSIIAVPLLAYNKHILKNLEFISNGYINAEWGSFISVSRTTIWIHKQGAATCIHKREISEKDQLIVGLGFVMRIV